MTLRYVVGRLGQAVVVVVLVSMVSFALSHLGGDPARLLAGPNASLADVHRLSAALGLNRPVWVQYAKFVNGALHGNLGRSLTYQESVASLILGRVGATLELGGVGMAWAVVVGVCAGVVAAGRRGGVIDGLVRLISLIGQSMPVFWIGLLLILVFAVELRVLPASGRSGLSSVVLPAIALGSYPMAQIAALTRATMLDVLRQDYIRTAVVKGLPARQVLRVHALRNVLLPVLTVIGLQLGGVFGGAIITETVFAWPGVGNLSVQAVYAHDYPLVQGAVLFVATAFVLINLFTDLLYVVADPRLRHQT